MSKDKKEKTKKESESPAVALGRLGGKAVVKKYGTSHMSELSKKAVEARKKKLKNRISNADILNSRKNK